MAHKNRRPNEMRHSLVRSVTYVFPISDDDPAEQVLEAYVNRIQGSLNANGQGVRILAAGIKYRGEEDLLGRQGESYIWLRTFQEDDLRPGASDITIELAEGETSPLLQMAEFLSTALHSILFSHYLMTNELYRVSQFNFNQDYPLIIVERLSPASEDVDPFRPPVDLLGQLRGWGFRLWKHSRWDEELGLFYIRLGGWDDPDDPDDVGSASRINPEVPDNFDLPEGYNHLTIMDLYADTFDPGIAALIITSGLEGMTMKQLTDEGVIIINDSEPSPPAPPAQHFHDPNHRQTRH